MIALLVYYGSSPSFLCSHMESYRRENCATLFDGLKVTREGTRTVVRRKDL